MSAESTKYLSTSRIFGYAIAAYLLWLYPSINQFVKYIHSRTGLVAVLSVIFLAVFGSFFFLAKPPVHKTFSRWLIPVLTVGMTFVLVSGYRLAHSGRFGQGDDRGDALRVGLYEMLHGRYPYYARTFLHGAITPMPGAYLLDLPWYLLGGAFWLQNLFWVITFVIFLRWWFRSERAALVFFLLFIFLCPGSIRDYIAGGDYLANDIYVTIAFAFVMEAFLTKDVRPHWWRDVSALCIGIAFCSRPTYGAVLFPICCAIAYRTGNARTLLRFLSIHLATVALLIGPFLLYDAKNFTPLTSMSFHVEAIPAWMHPTLLLAAAGIAISCIAFRGSLDKQRLIGVAALSFAVVFIPYSLIYVAAQGISWSSLFQWAYGLPVTLFGAIWLIGSFLRERDAATNSSVETA